MTPDPTDPRAPFAYEPVPPDLLAWARQTFDDREFLEGVREIQATGGVQIEDFIAEIEAAARGL